MRRYKSEDGSYLEIDESDGMCRIAWLVDDDIGAVTGDRVLKDNPNDTDEDRKSTWEMMTADNAVRSFAGGKNSGGFYFSTRKQAQLAMLAANESLLNGGAPMPQWAVSALAAGWKPPKGWKP